MPDRLDVLLVDDDVFTRMTLITTLRSNRVTIPAA